MEYFNMFLEQSAKDRLQAYKTNPVDHWESVSGEMALALFRKCAERVPAYKDFLVRNKVNPADIVSVEDFARVPVTSKENYINQYPLKQLCFDGKIESANMISSSSGSMGVPNYWPRSDEQIFDGAGTAELIYKDFFEIDSKSTLYIVAFSLGMWVAGTYMMESSLWVAQKGYPFTVIPPGMDMDEILRVVQAMHGNYDQIVLAGYPPFIKNIVDEGMNRGVPWKDINIKFLFTGEAFTERWRDYLVRTTGIENLYTDSINIYGSADVGLVAHETPLTIYLRRKAAKNKDFLSCLFEAERVPSVNQFNPFSRYFETEQGHLIVTAPSGIPLVRYNTQDLGGVLSYDEIERRMVVAGVEINKEFKHAGIDQKIWKVPVVYLFGRGKFSSTIFGITIFPEYVKYVLDSLRLQGIVTGKYIISTEETNDYQQELRLKVELAKGIAPQQNYEELIIRTFAEELATISSEYKALLARLGSKVYPVVSLLEFGDPEYFPRGTVRKGA